MSSFRQQFLGGAFWSGVERFGQQGVQFVVAIILARLLEPAEFGLIAMIMVFTLVPQTIAFGGFGAALVQRKDISDRDFNTVFWYNAITAGIMVVVLWFCAPFIASFYSEPRLVLITKWSALSILFNGLALTNRAVLTRELQFKTRSIIALVAVLFSGMTGIVMAYGGYGVWALVAQNLVLQFVSMVIYWKLSSYRIRLQFSWTSFREMFSFGHNLMLSFALRAFFENVHALVIGKFYSPMALGFFHRAKRFSILCSQMPAQMVSQVNYPMLCRLQDNPQEALMLYQKVFKTTLLVCSPLLTGMAVVAPNMIDVLIGQKWMPCVPYLRLFCLIGFFYVLFMLHADVVRASGKGRSFLRLEMSKHAMSALAILLLVRFGILNMLMGECLASGVAVLLAARKAMKCLEGAIWLPLKWVLHPLMGSAIMGLCVHLVFPQSRGVGMLMLQGMVGIVVYGIALLLMRDDMAIAVARSIYSRVNAGKL